MSKVVLLDRLLKAKENELTEVVHLASIETDVKLRALKASDLTELRDECTYPNGDGGLEVNEDELESGLIARVIVEPKFDDAEILDALGVNDVMGVLEATLTAKDLQKLTNKIKELNAPVEVEEVKN